MSFIRRFIHAFKTAAQIGAYSEIADAEGFWAAGDKLMLAQFFASETGRRLQARLNNIVFRAAIAACSPNDDGDFERGKAHGIMLCVKAIEAHMPYTQEHEFTDADTSERQIEHEAEVSTL